MWRLPRNVGTRVSTRKTGGCSWGSYLQIRECCPRAVGWLLAAEAAAELGDVRDLVRAAVVGVGQEGLFSSLVHRFWTCPLRALVPTLGGLA